MYTKNNDRRVLYTTCFPLIITRASKLKAHSRTIFWKMGDHFDRLSLLPSEPGVLLNYHKVACSSSDVVVKDDNDDDNDDDDDDDDNDDAGGGDDVAHNSETYAIEHGCECELESDRLSDDRACAAPQGFVP